MRARTAERTNLDYFLLAYFFYQFGLYGASPFLALYMQQLGGSPLLITAMFAAGVICEVLVMTRIGRWTDTYGRRPALAASFLLMPIRLLLYVPATGPLWVLCVQSLHGINFGIVGTMAVVFVNDLAGDANRGALQARLAVTSGLALAIAPLLCGWLSDQIGIRGMFAAMSLVGAAAAVLFVAKVRDSHPSPATPPGLLRYLA
jgi:PPP family 3-phenylpropionic acid transporter